MGLRFPSVLGAGVSFPRDQILMLARGSPVGMDSFHLILFFSIDELTRLRNEVRAKLRSFLVRGEKRSMEDTVHFPSRGKGKAVGIRGDDLRDFEGALLSRGQFSGGEVNLQVMRVELDLCSYFPGGELHSNPFFDCLSCLSMGSRSLFVSSI